MNLKVFAYILLGFIFATSNVSVCDQALDDLAPTDFKEPISPPTACPNGTGIHIVADSEVSARFSVKSILFCSDSDTLFQLATPLKLTIEDMSSSLQYPLRMQVKPSKINFRSRHGIYINLIIPVIDPYHHILSSNKTCMVAVDSEPCLAEAASLFDILGALLYQSNNQTVDRYSTNGDNSSVILRSISADENSTRNTFFSGQVTSAEILKIVINSVNLPHIQQLIQFFMDNETALAATLIIGITCCIYLKIFLNARNTVLQSRKASSSTGMPYDVLPVTPTECSASHQSAKQTETESKSKRTDRVQPNTRMQTRRRKVTVAYFSETCHRYHQMHINMMELAVVTPHCHVRTNVQLEEYHDMGLPSFQRRMDPHAYFDTRMQTRRRIVTFANFSEICHRYHQMHINMMELAVVTPHCHVRTNVQLEEYHDMGLPSCQRRMDPHAYFDTRMQTRRRKVTFANFSEICHRYHRMHINMMELAVVISHRHVRTNVQLEKYHDMGLPSFQRRMDPHAYVGTRMQRRPRKVTFANFSETCHRYHQMHMTMELSVVTSHCHVRTNVQLEEYHDMGLPLCQRRIDPHAYFDQ